jgi:hypothetical protein
LPSLSGGTPSYAWTATGLPAGMSIDPSGGTISGTPTTAGTSSVVVTVSDVFNQTSSVTFSWVVLPALVAANQTTQTSTVNAAISGLQMTATGGTGTYTNWSASGLPSGLSISPTTGKITGTPKVVGTSSNVVVTVTDSAGNTDATTAFSWVVVSVLTLTAPGAQSGEVNIPITGLQLTPAGGAAPYVKWAATGLPGGLSINTSTGLISGTPTTAGTSASVIVTVTDSAGTSASTAKFSWVITAQPNITTPVTNQSGKHNTKITNIQAVATGGTGTLTWTQTGLPGGITMTTGGLISGKPTTAGTYTVVITVTDSVGGTDSQTITWTVT